MLRLATFLIAGALAGTSSQGKGVWTDPHDASLPVDFKIQGEYVGDFGGAQVIALGNGAFQAVLYPGGLPGAGWEGQRRMVMDGKLEGEKAVFKSVEGKKRYLGKSPAEFSATRKYPPEGHVSCTGAIADGALKGYAGDAGFSLKKTVRKSPTMGQKPPSGAVALFDGSNKDEWQGGRVDEKTRLLNTDGRDIKTKRKFSNYTMHLEFMLPYKPLGRGQGRGNSGFYQVDHYEVQVLDSFGLEGLNNECGGIYSQKNSDVNMCLPPLTWQTYDVEFRNAVAEGGKKTKNAVITVKLNGVVIHDNYELRGKTGGSRSDPEGTPGPIKLQGHGNPLQYRNVWIVEK